MIQTTNMASESRTPIRAHHVKKFALENIVWILLVISICAMGSMNTAFFKMAIIGNILMQTACLGVLTAGQAQALLVGEIDLSIVGIMAFSAGLGTTLMKAGLPWPLAVVFIILFALVMGWINGMLITKLGATALISTLAVGKILEGALMTLTEGVTIVGFPDGYLWIARASIGRFPLLPVPFLLVFLAIWFVWNKTTLGRSLFAVGGSSGCARVSGISVDRTKIIAFMLSGLCAGIAGYLLSSYIAAVTMTFGTGYDMNTLAAAVIGGVSLTGGRGRVSGVLGGVLLITVIQVGLQVLGISPYMTTLLSGVMIFIAVVFDAIKTRGLRR